MLGTDHYSCIASLPSFLADADLWDGFFSPRAHLDPTPGQSRTRSYLACHRWRIDAEDAVLDPPTGGRRLVFEIALSLLERGLWTLPSWNVEQRLAEQAASQHGWAVERPQLGSGNLRLTLKSRVSAAELSNVLIPCPFPAEVALGQLVENLCGLSDQSSPNEQTFLREVAGPVMGAGLLSALTPQREAVSMGLDSTLFTQQRVDFALETYRGARLVIEIDGSQHQTSGAQRHADLLRREALALAGWNVWAIQTSAFSDCASLRVQLTAKLNERGIKPESYGGDRNVELAKTIWAATACSRIQALVLESVLSGVVANAGPLKVSVREHQTAVGDVAIADLDLVLKRISAFYGIPDRLHVVAAGEEDSDLVVDISVFNPCAEARLTPLPRACSRPACRAMEPVPRRMGVGLDSPRFFPAEPDDFQLDEFVRDLFRKDGFRRDPEGHSDQAAIVSRILMGKDVVGLLPTGAGKSLPYMLAGLLLPGLTLYVGPLKSLLQDQAERLLEAGIGHVKYISSGLDIEEKKAILDSAASSGVRFLLVSPERFLTRSFIEALNNRKLWQGDISQVVIDECHCVSEWGHEFRPAYLSLGRIARDRSARFATSAPLVALTGTASTMVLSDVIRELGISDPQACIRASSLDRPELTMKCTRVMFPDRREQDIEKSVREFLSTNSTATDGALIFCPFKGGRTIGVFSLSAHLSSALPGVDIQFFSGGSEPWADYAVYAKRKKASQLTKDDIKKATPKWGLNSAQETIPWEQVKAAVQRNFVSGSKGNFRVLVATKAFGMGIDKPSIRKIIHAVAPTSPEAFYQEVGRAGRDRRPSEAELFFCDIEAAVTDRLLDPGISQPESQKVYRDFIADNKFGGGDFLRTYYFQDRSFSGKKGGVDAILLVVKSLHEQLAKDQQPVVPFGVAGSEDESDGEHAIVRLIHLGVVDSYFKDYKSKVFEVSVVPEWALIRRDPVGLAGYLSRHYERFFRRYKVALDSSAVRSIAEAVATPSEAYRCSAAAMMDFVYEHIELRRRRATRQMLELTRVGLRDAADMRRMLLNYLQVSLRYTALLEALSVDAPPSNWLEVLADDLSPQDIGELHGACQRVLESYPSHPGLLFLAAVSRSLKTGEDVRRSEEELAACISFCLDKGVQKRPLLEALLHARKALGSGETEALIDGAMGLLHLEGEFDLEEAIPFLEIGKVRDRWLAVLISATLNNDPLSELENA